MIVEVQTPNGKVVDHVGKFALAGSWLAAYVWNASDRGVLDFKVMLTQNGKTVASISYPVRIT